MHNYFTDICHVRLLDLLCLQQKLLGSAIDRQLSQLIVQTLDDNRRRVFNSAAPLYFIEDPF